MANSESVLSVLSAGENDIGIDLGTANTVIYQKNKGIVLREPSFVAVDTRTDEVVAAGKEAKDMQGKTPDTISLSTPMCSGAVGDAGVCVAMLKYFLRKVLGSFNVKKPRVVIGVPSGITDVERKAVEDSAKQAGIFSVYLIELPMAAAVGAGLHVGSPKGSMVINFGAGITEAAVVALGDTVSSSTARYGSYDIDDAIRAYIRKKYGLIIGQQTAEEIKHKVGSAYPTEDTYNLFMEVHGRSAAEGLPKSYTIHADEIRSVILSSLDRIVETMARCLEMTPPELVADIMGSTVVLAGGAAQLRGLDRYLAEQTGLKFIVAERPFECAASGIGKTLDLVISGREMRRSRRAR